MSRPPKLPPPKRCCGCAACHDACPAAAIRMVPDVEGFSRPFIDAAQCLGCGRCGMVCPVLHPGEARSPVSVRAVKSRDDAIRLASSSGGVFSLLSTRVLERSGVVYGVAFDPEDGRIRHVRVTSSDGLSPLRGSKYVQSDAAGVYRAVLSDIRAGRPVLFSGTPCQIAAMRRCVGGSVAHLLLCEIVCMGVSSPLAFKTYLAAIDPGRNVRSVSFRSKRVGWKHFSMELFSSDGVFHSETLRVDPYLKGMLARLFLRPSCSSCPFRGLRSGADVTLGDFWNVHRRFPDMDDDRGTSLVLASTERGETAICDILPVCDYRETNWLHAIEINPALVRSKPTNSRRTVFFRCVGKENFVSLVARLTRPPAWKRMTKTVVSFVSRTIRKMKEP